MHHYIWFDGAGTGWAHNGTKWEKGTGTNSKFIPGLVDPTCDQMAKVMGRMVGWCASWHLIVPIVVAWASQIDLLSYTLDLALTIAVDSIRRYGRRLYG